MTTIYVTFTDAGEATIQGVFAVDQPPGVYENYGSVDSSDPRYKSWYDAQPDWTKIGYVTPDSE